MRPTLHHYPTSPFAELIRVALGLKGLDWGSVIIPNIMPKPDVIELTGNYARTPVLQIGADIYCDTAAICDALEVLKPEPSLYPAPLGALHRMIAGWAAGPQFLAHVGAAMGEMPPGALPQAFVEDRKARFGLDLGALAKATPHLKSQALTAASWLETLLGDGRAFIGGDAAGHGDLALYANLWFIRNMPLAVSAKAAVEAMPQVMAWMGRVAAIGHGSPVEMTSAEAIAEAAAATPAAVKGTVETPFAQGQQVAIRTDGSGDAPTAGKLVRCDASGVTVLRTGERCGPVAVHFPRLGQMVVPA